ncbi:MAG: MoaD/ThiS family protein [Proteobacteria bacterium]|nr:MAG: MoaD/ThiS family protein [Pseudomonadota bacterium]
MPTVSLTPNLDRHVETPDARLCGGTVRQVLELYFEANPGVRGYVLDDQGAIRHHVVVFLNNAPIRDRRLLSDPVGDDDAIFIFQALSGG